MEYTQYWDNFFHIPDYLKFAFKEQSVVEIPGPGSNARIGQYLQCVGLPPDDAIPWCVAGGAFCLQSSGYKILESGLARDWLRFYERWAYYVIYPIIGAVCLLWRDSPDSGNGHFGFYICHDNENVYLYGGNQGNTWSIAPFNREQVLGFFPEEIESENAMTATSHNRGTHIFFVNGKWIDCDTDKEYACDKIECPKCGRHYKKCDNSPDGCLGYLPGVDFACCGHGNRDDAYIAFKNGVIIRGFTVVRGIKGDNND